MSVIVDTSVWSLAYRRSSGPAEPAAVELGRLVREERALMLGPVRQELLSGVRGARQFESLRSHLRAFLDVGLETADYERAAAFSNRCRSRGIQGSPIDFLICAASSRRRCGILTTDGDFTHYARVLGIALHQPRPATE